jgi:tetratricopeptide (TPR) repeat protein
MNGQTYIPNYPSFANIKKWLQDGTLLDENISGKSLAGQLKLLVSNEHELNSLGYLLLHHNRNKEALKIFEANYHLYPQSPNIISSLGEGYLKNGNNKVAVSFLERALELNKDPADFKELLYLLYEAKGLK